MADNSVTEFELAVLVLGYLQQGGFAKTASRFKGEARPLFRAAGGTAPPPGVRNLRDLLNDYVRLKEVEKRRAALAACNPLAGRLLELLDGEAPAGGAQAAAGTAAGAQAAAAQQAAAAAAASAQWLQQQQQQMAACAGYPAGPAAGDLGGEGVEHDTHAPQPQQQQLAAGGAAPGPQRKGVPRKRRRGADGGAAAALPAFPAAAPFPGGGEAGGMDVGWAAHMDLLSLPLDASGLELLLDDGPLQLAFAEHLAQHINTTALTAHPTSAAAKEPASGGAPGGAAGGGAGGSSGGAGSGGYLAELVADPQMVLADLPADPRMAEVLQQVVRPGTASPPAPAAVPAAPAGGRPPMRGAGSGRRVQTAPRRRPQQPWVLQQLDEPAVPLASPAQLPAQPLPPQEQLPAPQQQQQQPGEVQQAAGGADTQLAAEPAAEVPPSQAGSGRAAEALEAATQPADAGLAAEVWPEQAGAMQEAAVQLARPEATDVAAGPAERPQGAQRTAAVRQAVLSAAAAGGHPAVEEQALPMDTDIAAEMQEAGREQAGAEPAAEVRQAGPAHAEPVALRVLQPRGQQPGASPGGNTGAAPRCASGGGGGPCSGGVVAAAAAAVVQPPAVHAVVALNAKLASLGPVELPADKEQLLADIDDLF